MQNTAIDAAHADLVRGLVVSFKPENALEIGYGTGVSSDAIIRGIWYNQNNAKYTLVDNWHDFGGKPPVIDIPFPFTNVEVITSNEKDFVKKCTSNGRTFDLIFSDADHLNADKWFDETYRELLSSPGILIYHDVTSPDFPNLKTIHDIAVQRKLPHFLFNRESRPDERCSRGLLVIFKACD